jgi:hypothetical protein
MTVGMELGVQSGLYAERTLKSWTNCKHMTVVDVWAHLSNSSDLANVPDEEQEKRLR